MKLVAGLAAAAIAALVFPSAAEARGAAIQGSVVPAPAAHGMRDGGGAWRGHFGAPSCGGRVRSCRRHRDRDGDREGDGYALAWGGGYADPYATPPPAGFFADGGEVRVADGRAIYDYDRSYPYDHASRWMPAPVPAPELLHRCSVTWVDGGEPVRVCRN